MTKPWLPAGFETPARVDLPSGHHLRRIRESDVDIDYPAVMGSRGRLWRLYGGAWGWPTATMTYEQDRCDLARHEREIANQESFNFAVLDVAETELLGCVYIDPPDEDHPDADALVSWWLVDRYARGPVQRTLDAFVPAWLRDGWGLPGYVIEPRPDR